MSQVFVSLFVIKQGKKKKDHLHRELERKLPYFFTSNVRNNNFPTLTVGFHVTVNLLVP